VKNTISAINPTIKTGPNRVEIMKALRLTLVLYSLPIMMNKFLTA
jgi:hypothetical protein